MIFLQLPHNCSQRIDLCAKCHESVGGGMNALEDSIDISLCLVLGNLGVAVEQAMNGRLVEVCQPG